MGECHCGVKHRHKITEGDIWESRLTLNGSGARARIVQLLDDGVMLIQEGRHDGPFKYDYETLLLTMRKAKPLDSMEQ